MYEILLLGALLLITALGVGLFWVQKKRRLSATQQKPAIQEPPKQELQKALVPEIVKIEVLPEQKPIKEPEIKAPPKQEPTKAPEIKAPPKQEPTKAPEIKVPKIKAPPEQKPIKVPEIKAPVDQGPREAPEIDKPKVESPKIEIPASKDLGSALKNTRSGFMAKIARLFSRGPEISEEDFEEMEAILFSADIGPRTAQKLLDGLRARVKSQGEVDKAFLRSALKDEMRAIFNKVSLQERAAVSPQVFMFVGVNGAGKTTTMGKMGAQMTSLGKKVLFGAGDTFRAAAVKQLSVWGERAGIPVVSGKENADSASVLFEAISQAKRDQADIIMCDTAGRLHSKVELMDELKKVHRVIGKALEGAPHEVFLVVDATMGQNAIAQAREFAQATPLTGLVLSKLDGTAKGGVALGIVDELSVPIRFVGIGEQVGDLKAFNSDEFVDALFEEEDHK